MLLSSCALTEDTSSEQPKPIKAKKKKNSELDRLIFAPPELSLDEAKQKYVHAPISSKVLSEAASRAADKADNDAAEKLASEAIRLDPKNGDAFYQRGRARCNIVAGKDTEAIEDLQKAISLGLNDSSVHLILARLYDNNKQPKKAIESLTIAIKLAPTYKDLYKSRAALYVSVGEPEKALADYHSLSKLDPDNSALFYQRGQIFESLKKFDEAAAEYKKIFGIDESKFKVPMKPLAYKRLASINSTQGKHKDAVQNLTEACKFDADDDEPVRLRGLEYAQLQDYKKAIADLNQAIEMSPDSSANFAARAEIYAKMGDTNLAGKDRLEAKRLHDVPAERPLY